MADLFGKYRLLAKIASGVVAEVFQAKSHGVEGFEKVVVIKRIRREFSADRRFVGAFIESVKKAVMLAHANVVQVFDLGQHEDRYFLAMEHVAGPNLGHLARLLAAEGERMPLDLALWTVGEVVKGLDHAHRRRGYGHQPVNVVHAGVIPTNVLTSREGEVKLTDFGFGLALRHLIAARPELIQRDRPYMAPELLDPSGEFGERADLFGAGAILHHLVFGAPPIPGVPRPEREVPPALEDILERALAPDPADRFASASDLHERLVSLIFENGWKPSPRTLADLLARVTVADGATSEERLEELSLDDVLLLDDSFDATMDVADAELLALFDDSPPDDTTLRVEIGDAAGAEPRPDTAVARPAARRVSLQRSSTIQAVVAAVHSPSGEEPPGLEAEAERWGARLVRLPSMPPHALFESGTVPGRAVERALRFALALARVQVRRPSVGVHLGTVGGRLRADVFVPDHDDPAVIRASDLARAGMPGDVLVSEEGPSLVPEVFAFSPPFQLADGKAAHRVGPSQMGTAVRGVPPPQTRTSAAPAPDDPPPRTRRGTMLVPPGREEDLAAVLRAVEATRGAKPRVLVVEGPDGFGKTAVLRAARRGCARLQMAWFTVRLDPVDQRVPFTAVRALLGEVCGFEEDDDAAVLRGKVDRLAQLGVGSHEVQRIHEAMALDPVSQRDWVALFSAVLRRVATSLGVDQPTAFVVEDADNLDPESRAVLLDLVEHLSATSVLLWLSGPAGSLDDFARRPGALRRRLSALGDLGLRFLARRTAARSGEHDPPPALVDLVVERAAGDPAYLTAAMRLVIDEGWLGEPERWGELPEGLDAVLQRRLARLPDEERGLLERAAAIGRTFGLTLLSRVVRQRPEQTAELLDVAVGGGLVERAGGGRYAFKWRRVQELLYDGIEPYARREVHARIALEIEALHQADRDRFIDVLARHTSMSGDTGRALNYLERIADRFMAARAPGAALGPLREAARLLADDPETDGGRRIELLLRVGDVAMQAMRFDHAREALGAALDLARRNRRERAVACCMLSLGRLALAESRFDEAGDLLGRALHLSDGLRDRNLVGQIYGALGETWQKNGDLRRAVDFLGRAVRLAEEEGDTARVASLLPLLANAAGAAGDSASAERWIVRALRAAEGTGDRLMRARVLKAYGLLDYFRGDFRQGLERCLEGLALAEELEAVEDAVVLSHNAGDMCMQLGDYRRAFHFFTQSLELCRAHGLSRTELTNEIYLVWLEALRHGDPPAPDAAAEAEPKLRELWARAEEAGLKWEALNASWFVALALAARGEPRAAIPLLEQVRSGANQIHLAFMVRRAETALAEMRSAATTAPVRRATSLPAILAIDDE